MESLGNHQMGLPWVLMDRVGKGHWGIWEGHYQKSCNRGQPKKV